MRPLRTSSEIRKALGNDYKRLVGKYDRKSRERKATYREAKQLKPELCAACGRKPPQVFHLEAAHISPLAECSTTHRKNLLLLCREQKGGKELGCHTLFDQGYCSIREMINCRKDWIASKPATLRSSMLALKSQYGPQPQLQGHLRKELQNLRRKKDSCSSGSQEWHDLQIRIAELTRRRAKKDSIERAWNEITKVNPKDLQSSPLLSRYFYEKGYIELHSERLNDAFADFYEGRRALESNINAPGNRWRWAAHTALLAQLSCVMRYKDTRAKCSWDTIRKELIKALKYSRKARNDALKPTKSRPNQDLWEDYRNASRWVQNCLFHLVKPYIAKGQLRIALKQWNRAYNNWLGMNISNGWDTGFRTTHLWLYGKLFFELGQIDDALAHLVRSLVCVLGLRRQQPEGIRDLLFTLADALKRKNDPMHKRVLSVASRCYEFSSWFNPYVPG